MSVIFLKNGNSFLFKNTKEYKVQKRCDIVFGKWLCTTCHVSMKNEAEKQNHINAGDHTLVWCCPQHGYESLE